MRWIKITNKLPSLNEKYGESDYVLGFENENMPVVCWYHKSGEWIVAHHKADSLPIKITHWMPLPEPPKPTQ